MDDALIKPDVLLVTKNVMVPLALPTSKNKFFPNPLSSKKKTKIVKTRKYRTMPKSEDADYACRDRKEKFSQKKPRSTDYLDSNYNSSINIGDEHYEYLYSQVFAIEDTNFNENAGRTKNMRQNFLSESFPTHTISNEPEEERRKIPLPRSSRSLISSQKNNNVRLQKDERLFLKKKTKENEVELSQVENEEVQEVSGYKIKSSSRKNSFGSLKSCSEDDKNEDKKSEELSLEKSRESGTQHLQDDIEIIINKVDRKSSAISIDELHRCISNDISSKLSAAVDKEDSKSIEDNKCEIKYSWQDLENWLPPSEKKKIAESKKHLESLTDRKVDCKIKYSWQVIGTGAQTSYDLMENFLSKDQIDQNKENEAKNYSCSVKYSWQIIGLGTQVNFSNREKNSLENDKEYWEGNILKPRKQCLEQNGLKNGIWKAGKCKILYSEGTQTFAEKSHQTEMTECRAKYSWQNLTRTYLATNKFP